MVHGLRTATAVAVSFLLLGACATVTRGPNTDWQVSTTPSGAKVQTSNGLGCEATPCSLQLSRKASFTATVSKPGYKPVKVLVSPHFSRNGGIAMAGNVIVGGLIGMGVDVASGAINDLTPNDLDLKLERDETSFGFDAQSYPAFPLRPPSSALAPTQSLAALTVDREPPPRANAVIDSRVVSIKVLADRTVEELREPSQ